MPSTVIFRATMAPSWGDVIRVVVRSGAGDARGLAAGLVGMSTSRSVGRVTGCSGSIGEDRSGCGASCGIWSAAGDVGRSGWNAEVAGNVATCADSVGIAGGAAVGRAISAGVGSTESVDPKGDETVLTDC